MACPKSPSLKGVTKPVLLQNLFAPQTRGRGKVTLAGDWPTCSFALTHLFSLAHSFSLMHSFALTHLFTLGPGPPPSQSSTTLTTHYATGFTLGSRVWDFESLQKAALGILNRKCIHDTTVNTCKRPNFPETIRTQKTAQARVEKFLFTLKKPEKELRLPWKARPPLGKQ